MELSIPQSPEQELKRACKENRDSDMEDGVRDNKGFAVCLRLTRTSC